MHSPASQCLPALVLDSPHTGFSPAEQKSSQQHFSISGLSEKASFWGKKTL